MVLGVQLAVDLFLDQGVEGGKVQDASVVLVDVVDHVLCSTV